MVAAGGRASVRWPIPSRLARARGRALAQAGREERVDGRSLADGRDAAHREGDRERAAALSREPNIHLGPERYRTRGGASATAVTAAAVKQRTATAPAERDADRQHVARVERESAAVGARLQETDDRVRRARDGAWPRAAAHRGVVA